VFIEPESLVRKRAKKRTWPIESTPARNRYARRQVGPFCRSAVAADLAPAIAMPRRLHLELPGARCMSRNAASTRARSSSMRTIATPSGACSAPPSAITTLPCMRSSRWTTPSTCWWRPMRSGHWHVQCAGSASPACRLNLRRRRCGALWQGCFKSCLVLSERYLLTVMRCIELKPVRAAMVEAAQDYRWSSVHTHPARARDTHHAPPALPRDGKQPRRVRPYLPTMARSRHRVRRPAAPARVRQPGTRPR